MAFADRLAYIITANGKDAIREFRSVRDAARRDLGDTGGVLGRFNATAGGLGAGLKGFGAGLLASFGIGAVGDLADAASELEQSAGAIESVFGDAAGAIEAFGEQAAETAGLSRREVNEMASVIGSQLQGMGYDAETAAQKTILLERRAADMAATFGGTTSDAISAISALLRGERDPIERYGVSLKDADVQARIAAAGMDTSSISAKKFSNAAASLDLVLQATARTEGQFAREADTAAGAQARAAAEYENAKASLGRALLPLQTKVTGFLAREARGVDRIVGFFSDLAGGSDDAADAADRNADAQNTQADAIQAAADAAARAEASVEDYRDALDELRGSAFDVKGAQDDVTQSILDLAEKATDADRKRASSSDRVADAVERANRRIRDAERGVADAREDLNRIPSGDRSAARDRLADAEQRLADVRAEAEESIAAARETREELDEWTPSLDRATAAGLENRGVIETIIDRVLTVAEKMKEQGANANEINGYLDSQRTLIGDVATRVGFSRDAMREYLDLLGRAKALEASRPTLPTINGVTGPWSPEKVANTPQLPTINGETGPFSPIYIQINAGETGQQLAERISREVARQLRRRG